VTTYEVGQTATVALKVYDSAGALADLGGGNPTCTVTKPDGTTTTATVTKNSTGYYQGAYTTTTAGRHRFTFTGTGTNSGALPWSDVVDVWPADPRLILSLSDAKAALNVPAGTRVNDDELRLYIAATTAVIEDIVGSVLTTSKTETFDGGTCSVPLSQRATAITSVVVGGTTLTAGTQYVANLVSGLVYAGSTSSSSTFTSGAQNVVVTYTTGSSSIDPNVILAAREEVRFLYQIGQQGGRPSLGGAPTDLSWTPSGFAVPQRVIELCAASAARRMPGFA
jgi:hypothetical protein